MPTDAYTLEEAVKDGYLVPDESGVGAAEIPAGRDQTTTTSPRRRKRSGMQREWSEDGGVPDRVEAEAVNKMAFQRGYRGQGAGAPDDPRAARSRWRSAG